MTNIIFNSNCNRQCAYCFSHLNNKETRQLTLDKLTFISDFLQRSGKRKVNVLGGEPTIHPQFDLFLEFLLSRGFVVHVFTNGMMPGPVLNAIQVLIAKRQLTRQRLKFIVNVNEERYRNTQESRLQAEVFNALHDFSSLSFNIFENGCRLDFLTELIETHHLIPEIRLGLAFPVDGKGNRFLPLKEYRSMAKKILAFSDKCQVHAVDLVFDCGFPLCIFNDEEIGKLYKHKTQLKFVCRPIPDIDPDLNVFHCYPLSGYFPQPLSQFRDLKDVHNYFSSLLERSTPGPGIFEECGECEHRRRGMCAGGCKGHFIDKKTAA
jgi:MoaA/NifB/PqqE/SkfB family radical SAM enzyme